MNPKLGDLAASTPRMTTHAGDDAIVRVSYCRREFFAVEQARRIRVELVDPFRQKRFDLVALALGEFDWRQHHLIVPSCVHGLHDASIASVVAENPRSVAMMSPRR